MPSFWVQCSAGCQPARRKLAENRAEAVKGFCPACEAPLQSSGTGPSAQVLEKLDNGLMVRALERPVEAERLHRERAAMAPVAAGQSLRKDDQ